jgi:hypothetical protein
MPTTRKEPEVTTPSEQMRAQFSPVDAEKLARLTEEIRGRLEEIAHITARTLGKRLDKGAVRKFVPHEPAADSPTVVEVEILDEFLGPGTAPCCLVVLSDGDWFVECPCGAAG